MSNTFKKALLVLMLAHTIAFAGIVAGAMADGGTGSYSDPYLADTWAELSAAMTAGGYVKLTNDIIGDRYNSSTSNRWIVEIDKNVSLDLNGHTIKPYYSGDDFIKVNNGGYFSLFDSGDGSGRIDLSATANYAVHLAGGSFDMLGGNIASKRVCIDSESSIFYMFGGSISNESSEAVWVNRGTFNMDDGALVDNYYGVYITNGTFNMSGGSITGNNVGVRNGYGIFSLSGSPVISNNTDADVWLIDDRNIDVTGALTISTPIAVKFVITYNQYAYRKQPGNHVFTTGYGTHNPGTAPTTCFRSGMPGGTIALSDANEAMLCLPGTITLSDAEGGSVESNRETAFETDTVTLTVKPAAGYRLAEDGLAVTYIDSNNTTQTVAINQNAENPNVYTFTMPAYSVTVTSAFTAAWAALQAAITEAGTTAATIDVSQFAGSDHTVTALPTDGPLTIASGQNITLDLNGCAIDRGLAGGDAVKNGNVITVDGVLTMTDGSANHDGTITGGNNTGNGGGVFVRQGGVLNLFGGSVSDNSAAYYGGGVYVDGGTLTQDGGAIIDNAAWCWGGGACIYGSGARFTLERGSISSNHSTDSGNYLDGGGVYVGANASFTMNGGSIAGNSTKSCGGGVYVANKGTFDMTGGTIGGSANSAKSGGGIYVNTSGTFCMSLGAEITGNTATGDGGGIFSYNAINISGGNISGNAAADYGSGIYLGSGGAFSGGTISENIGRGGSVYLYAGELIVSDNAAITGNTDIGVYNNDYGKLTLNGGTISDNSDWGVYDLANVSHCEPSGYIGMLTLNGGTISRNSGGGVYSYRGFKLSGTTIAGNTGKDLAAKNVVLRWEDYYPENPVKITVTGTLSDSTIGVRYQFPKSIDPGELEEGIPFTTGLSAYGSEANFVSEMEGFKVRLNADNEAELYHVTYPVWVGGVQVNSANMNNVLKDGAVSYNPNSKTLTFTSKAPSLPGIHQAPKALIYAEDDLIIDTRQNGLELSSSAEDVYGVYGTGNITINGDVDIRTGYEMICSEGNIAIAGDVTGESRNTNGISAGGYVNITGDVDLKAPGYMVIANGRSYDGTGIYVDGSVKNSTNNNGLCTELGSIWVTGDVNLTCSGPMICAGTVNTSGDGNTIGVYIGGDVNGSGRITAKWKVVIKGSIGSIAPIEVSNGNLVYSEFSSIEIDGNVTGKSPNGSGLYTPLSIHNTNGYIKVLGDVDLTVKDYMIYAAGCDANGTAIYIGGNVNGSVSDGTNLYSSNRDITIKGDVGSADAPFAGSSSAVDSYLIHGRNVSIEGSVTAEKTNGTGIKAASATILGDRVIISATGGNGINAGTITVGNGKWHITSDGAALLANNDLIIPETHGITTPVGGIFGNYGASKTILNGEVPANEAVIEPVYTITFSAGDGKGSMPSVTIAQDAEYTLPACSFTAPEGHVFKEWSVKIGEADAMTMVQDEKVAITMNTAVTALWEHRHDWGEPTYTWANDNSKVTASRVCKLDAEHVETEEAIVTSEETRAATCTDKGEITYTSAAFLNPAFAVQSKSVATDMLGHDWGAPTYSWADDNSQVTAERVCKRDENHRHKETVQTLKCIVKSPTETEMGKTCFTACFENVAFAVQEKAVADIPALKDLRVLVLPSMLKEINDESFMNLACEAVIIPEGCTAIGEKAFMGCSKLIYVKIPASVTEIAEDAFENCDLVRIDRLR